MKRYTAFFALTIAPLVGTGCCAPQECAPAIEGKSQSTSVINALDNYNLKYSIYPNSLKELTPDFLSHDHSVLDKNFTMLGYKKLEQGYELTFEYTRPGQNICKYSKPSNDWHCSGHF